MVMLSILADWISAATLVILFYNMFEWRYSRRVVKIIIGIFILLSSIGYSISYIKFSDYGISIWSLVWFTVPGFILYWIIVKYRDFRLVFTYSVIDMIGFAFSLIIRIAALSVNNNGFFILFANIIVYGILINIFMRIRMKYWEILRNLESNWGLMSIVVIGFYGILFFASTYPEPLIDRLEYTPLVLFLCLLAIATTVVMFSTLNAMKQNNVFLDKLQRQEIYERYAYCDILTGMRNRRGFEEDVAAAVKAGEPIGYAILDLNDLKKINDTIGHAEGDKLLQKVPVILSKYQSHILSYRIGGDEFAIISKLDNRSNAERVFRNIGKEFENSDVSAALGYGWLENYGPDDVAGFMKDVDALMYENKKKMKNIQQKSAHK